MRRNQKPKLPKVFLALMAVGERINTGGFSAVLKVNYSDPNRDGADLTRTVQKAPGVFPTRALAATHAFFMREQMSAESKRALVRAALA